MITNTLIPAVKLPFKLTKGSIQVKQRKANQLVRNLIGNIQGSLKRETFTTEELEEHIMHILPKKMNIYVLEGHDKNFIAYSDVLHSEKNGKIKALTIELPTKNNIVKADQLVNIAHEFQHIADQIYHPKYLARNQFMTNKGLLTKKYNDFYDKYIYNQEFTNGKNDRKKVIKKLELKLKHFFRGMGAEDKVNYLQDSRYTLQMEENAYYTQYKYAKKFNKKHNQNIDKEDLIKWNKSLMFTEKINLLKQMAFEIIKEERKKHAFQLKKIKKCKQQIPIKQ